MVQSTDYYSLLGVGRGASQKDIKAAYHRLARQYHPDVNPDNPAAEEHFKQINAAYEVLGDPHRRAVYDRRTFVGQTYRREARPRQTWHTWSPSTPARGRYSVEEMNRFVISRLERLVAREAIIWELHQWAGIDWLQAASFVRYAEIIYRCDLARRKRQSVQLAMYTSVSLGGVLLNYLMGTALNAFYPFYGDLVGIVLVIGAVLFVGGLIGSIRTLSDMG